MLFAQVASESRLNVPVGAVKSANVEIVEWRKVGSGYVSFVIEGDVAAVRSAIDSGVESASKIGEVLSQLIIPRPVDEMDTVFKD